MKFEYRVITISVAHGEEEIEKQLNMAGYNEWELTTSILNGNHWSLVFKKSITEKRTSGTS